MNRIYKVIWSKVKHQYVVVSELAHSCTKSTNSRVGRSAAAVLAALVLTTGLCAAPVQAEDLTDPYALLNAQVEETNSTSSDTLVTLVQSPLAKSVAPLANEDEEQPGEGGSSTVTTPDGQHTIYNEEGFYAHNGQGTYNSLTKDGLFVGGTDNGEGLYVDNDGNIYTDGNAEIEGSFSAADGNATIAADGTTVIRAGGSQLVVKDGAAGITHGNAIMAVSSNKAEMQGGGSSVIADLNGVTLTERTGNTTVTVNQDGMTVGGGLTAGNLQTEGPLHAGSAVIDGSATVGGKLTAGDVKTNTVDAHNVSVDNELTAGKATIDGTLTAGSAAINGNADITGTATVGGLKTEGKVTATNAEITNLKAGKADVEGIVRGGSFANTNDSFTVDDQGDVKAHNVTLTGTLGVAGATTLDSTLSVTGETTLTGALKANGTATFAQGASMGGKTITNVGDGEVNATSTDAVNGRQLQKVADTVKTYQAGNGIAIANGATQTPTISAKAADNGNIEVTSDGISLAKDVSGLTSLGTNALTVNNNATIGGTLGVTGETTLTGALKANGTATFAQGASMGGKTITNVGDGEVNATSTDAVNGRQLQKVADTVKTYQAGNGIAIANGATQTPTISAKAADNGNIEVTSDGISLAKDVRGLTSIDTGTITASGAASVGSLTTTGAISGGSVTAGTGLFSTSVTIGNTASSLKLADGEITGLVTNKIDSDTDAVNVEYLEDYVSKNGTGKTYTAGNGIAIDNNKISVKTAADGNLEVDANGVSLKDAISLTSVTTGAASLNTDGLTIGTTSLTSTDLTVGGKTYISSTGINANNNAITNVAEGRNETDAVNVAQLNKALEDVDGTTYMAGNGIDINKADNNKISVKAAADGNLKVDENGVSLKDDISLTSVRTSGAVTVGGTLGVTGATNLNSTLNVTGATTLGALTTNGTATFSQGASMNGQKITNVRAGTEGTDAVNRSQLDAVQRQIKTYTAGDGIAINEDDNNKISVKAAADGNLEVDANGVSLKDNISLTSVTTTGAVTAASVTAAGGFTINDSNSLTSSGLMIGGTQYITSAGLNAGSKVITNVSPGNNPTDAVNMSQLSEVKDVTDLAVTYTANTNKSQVYLQGTNGTTITNVAAGNISSADSKDAVNGGQLYTTNKIVGDGQYSSHNYITRNQTDLNLTDAVSALDLTIGNLQFDGNLTLAGQESTVTSALNKLDQNVGSGDFTTIKTPYLTSEYNLTLATDKLARIIEGINTKVGLQSINEDGSVGSIDWSSFHYIQGTNTTILSGMRALDDEIFKLDGRVTKLETASNALSTFSRSNISTLSALSNMDMSAVNTLSSLSADDLAAISTLSEDGSVPAANSDPNSRPGRGPSSGSEDSSTHDGNTQVMDHNLAVTGNVSVGGTLDVTGKATFGSDVSVGGNLDVQGETNMHGTLNMNNNKITGVTAGKISESSTDAVNGSQLWQTNQQVAANTENIGILGSAVNKLGDRIERVGAGAAALAALHPLDFDPDNKLDFAAGFGNYRGASAVAVGAFYRPSENVMFSVGGAFGGGEDMVNAGVSFKVGAGSGSATTSRTAMAKSLKSMQEVVASQDAQLAQQREQIDKLTAMVELLMEQNGQAQPKDGDAQAAQPQQ